MWRVFWTVGFATLLTAVGLTYVASSWVEREQEAELSALAERSALAVDMQFKVWQTAVSGLANSHALVLDFDVDALRWDAQRVAKSVGGWVALLPADDLSLHVFNTNRDTATPIRTSGPDIALSSAVARSRASGRAEVSDVFLGRVSNAQIFTVVTVAKASTGVDYAIVLAVNAGFLSRDLEKATLHEGEFISLVDGSNRIVARSSRIDEFFLKPVPEWFLVVIAASPPTSTVIAKGPGLPGSGAPSYLFARNQLRTAPNWSVTIAKSGSSLASSSYMTTLPILGSILVFGIALAFETARAGARRREADLQAARARSEQEQRLRVELENALEKAHAADTARRDMLGVLGHEMRTPVLSALAAIQMFPDRLKVQDARNYLGLAERGLKVLQCLIDDILDLARLRAGEIRIEKAPLDLADLLGEVADIMGPMAERHHLDFRLDWSAGPVSVIGDRARLRQILINLLTNAFRYTPAGHVTLSGSWQMDAEKICHVRLCVTDTGPGIAEDKIADIFKPFFRLEQGLGDRVKGLGLGLPITTQLADAMGGAITVKSEVGKGSTFCVVLDLPVAPTEGLPQAQNEGLARPSMLAGKSVLIVEDNILQAQMVAAVLQALDAAPQTATMGRDALEAIKHKQFDLILIDLGLPDMTGVDLVRHLRAAGSTAVHIALSANPASLRADESALFDAVATKTTSRSELGKLLAAALPSQLTAPH